MQASHLLPFAQVLLIILVVGLLWLITRSVFRVLVSMKMEVTKAEKISRWMLAGLVLWLLILTLLSFIGFFEDFESWPPKLFFGVLPPVVIIFYLLFSKSFGRFLRALPYGWPIYLQSFRFPLELILWIGFLGNFFPFQMTFEGFNFDIIVGLTAPLAGYVFFFRGRHRRAEAIIWNSFGLILLINIVIIAFLSAPSPFRIFMNEPANRMVAYFPFVWIPGFLVPLALALHLFSLKQLVFMSDNSGRKFTLRKK